MKLVGDEEGIAALKELHADNKEYLKFLMGEVNSNTDHKAPFKSKDGRSFTLSVDLATGALEVQPVE